jgi:hypothetical protein
MLISVLSAAFALENLIEANNVQEWILLWPVNQVKSALELVVSCEMAELEKTVYQYSMVVNKG